MSTAVTTWDALVRARSRVDVRVWERVGLIAVLVMAAAFRLWRLTQNGYGDTYYSAGVRSMLESWRNFFYNAYDPGGFISVDKPPVALWAQVASAKLLGFSSLSLLLPQALEGVAAVLLTYYLVRRVFGSGAGLLAGLVLAVMPVNVAVDRTNNTDSMLALVLLLAAWAWSLAAETGRRRHLLLGAALVGVGFNTKMLAACVVLPAFYLLYLLTAPLPRRTRLLHLAAASAVLIAVSFSWPLAVDLTPPSQRPYVGSSQNNTEFDLIFGHNGIARLVAGTRWGLRGPGGRFRGGQGPGGGAFAPGAGPGAGAFPPGAGPGDGGPFPPAGGPGAAGMVPPGQAPGAGGFSFAGGRGPGGYGGYAGPGGGWGFRGGPPGPLRLFSQALAGQVMWLFPLAAIGLLAAATRVRRRWPLDPRHQALLMWGAWLVSCAVIFSFARGIFHPYYLNTMAPPMAALAGAGLVALWADYQEGGWRGWLLPAALLLTAAWEARIVWDYPAWSRVLIPLVLLVTLAAAAVLIAAPLIEARPTVGRGWGTLARSAVPGALAVGFLALLVSPTAWATTPVRSRGNTMLPQAGPELLGVTMRGRNRAGFPGGLRGGLRGGFRGGPAGAGFPGGFRGGPGGGFGRGMGDNRKLIDFLKAHHHGERYLVATPNVMTASPIIIETGEPVMPIGGFMGSERIITADQFARLVAQKQVRYALASPFGGRMAGGNEELFRWVREHGLAVDRSLWQPARAGRGPGNGPGGGFPGGWQGGGFPAPAGGSPGGGGPFPPGGGPGAGGFGAAPGGGPGGGGFPGGWGGRFGRGGFMQLYDLAPTDPGSPEYGQEDDSPFGL